MLGEKRLAPKLAYQFSLDERGPADHLLLIRSGIIAGGLVIALRVMR